ncbi:MAG: cation:proton antiporter [Hyphomicrobiales bacterium]|nr:cation:proton antiporter [Hyphomicrobiales bacterium]MCP5373287.1 cation:proton antiporter [Hyphomicrobiales bacterium]
MPNAHVFVDVIVFLLATVVVVPLFERLRASPLVGYLIAGACIGPSGLALIGDVEGVRGFAELGIVVLLFTVGLELTVERLRVIGGRVLALGLAQVGVTTAVGFAVAIWFGVDINAAFVVGAALSLSSTAVVLQLMVERQELATHLGRTALGILLLQDVVVGPLLVLIPVLGAPDTNLLLAFAIGTGKAVLILAAIFVIGRVILRPVFRIAATAKAPELFMAATVLVVVGTGLAAHAFGLSMALGAFAAGLVLAGTEYRHQVMDTIQPFRGLLLGLFFMAVGMSADLGFAWSNLGLIGALIGALLVGKAVILAGLARLHGMNTVRAVRLGMLLAQGGAFAFVLMAVGRSAGVVGDDLVQVVTLLVAATMAVTPLLAVIGGWLSRLYEPFEAPGAELLTRDAADMAGHVVIAGFGRAGKDTVDRFALQGVPFVVLERNRQRVVDGRARGVPIYFVDARLPEVLLAARVDHARAVIVALGESRGARNLVALLRYLFPALRILARARDEQHGRDLMEAGADDVVVEQLAPGHRLAGMAAAVTPAPAPAPAPEET